MAKWLLHRVCCAGNRGVLAAWRTGLFSASLLEQTHPCSQEKQPHYKLPWTPPDGEEKAGRQDTCHVCITQALSLCLARARQGTPLVQPGDAQVFCEEPG